MKREHNADIDNFYDKESLHDSVDDGLISSAEEGFMRGYMDA